MTTVVDASVALKWYFPERGSGTADAILAEAIESARVLLAPDLIVAEFTNVLWRKTRLGECREDEATEILELWQTDRPTLVETSPLAQRALELALRLDHSVYDCLYLATAIEYEAGLVTADRELARLSEPIIAEVELLI